MKTKKRGLIIGAVVTAFAIVGTSFALWATTLSGNGSVSASGSWQVEFTDADLSVNSTGTAVLPKPMQLDRANVKDDTLVAATISSGKWLSAGQAGFGRHAVRQSDEPIHLLLCRRHCQV